MKIDKKITGYKVVDNTEIPVAPTIIEDLIRPEFLLGSTYKIKTPSSDHALYITINDYVLDDKRIPYEVFINSKNMEHFQWIIAMTRLISAVFRKGGDVTFLVDEMKGVFDPKGGYFKKGGVFMPSLVAEIGYCIEDHMIKIGLIKIEELPDNTKKILKEKREEFEAKHGDSTSEFPDKAVLCKACNVKASVLMDGCWTCLNCADSKCG